MGLGSRALKALQVILMSSQGTNHGVAGPQQKEHPSGGSAEPEKKCPLSPLKMPPRKKFAFLNSSATTQLLSIPYQVEAQRGSLGEEVGIQMRLEEHTRQRALQ